MSAQQILHTDRHPLLRSEPLNSMQAGDLVTFKSRHLAYDYEELAGTVGVLVRPIEAPDADGGMHVCWEALWQGKFIVLHETDLERV